MLKWYPSVFLPLVWGHPQYIAPMAISIGSISPFLEWILTPYTSGCSNHLLLASTTPHKFPLTGVLGSVSSLFYYPYHIGHQTLPWFLYPLLSEAEEREGHARLVISPGSPGSSASSLTMFRLSTYQISQREVVQRVYPLIFPSEPVPMRLSLPLPSTYLMYH